MTAMSRSERKKLNDEAVERTYDGGSLIATIKFKASDESDDLPFMKQVNFQGFANTGHPDLGRDIVEPSAFTRQTINEFLKYGRQLMFTHGFMEQVGEITAAEVVASGKRSIVGNKAGGLRIEGFVDSPFDEHGMIPDHPLAHVIHYARMQVQKNRLKALSIGWMPIKTQIKKLMDPRIRQEVNFRIIKSLILREISLVTFAMNPQSMIELRKAYAGAYGEDIAGALFSDDPEDSRDIPENVDGFQVDRLQKMMVDSFVNAAKAANQTEGNDPDKPKDDPPAGQSQMKLVSLDGRPKQTYKIVSLAGG